MVYSLKCTTSPRMLRHCHNSYNNKYRIINAIANHSNQTTRNLNYAQYGIYFLYLGAVSRSITLIYPPSTAPVRSLDALAFSFSPKPNIFRISELEIPSKLTYAHPVHTSGSVLSLSIILISSAAFKTFS